LTKEGIISFLIDTANWAALQKISSDTRQKFEEGSSQFNQYGSNTPSTISSEGVVLCDLGIGIAEIMLIVATTMEPLQGKMLRHFFHDFQ
jgi:hypothetical protein